MDPACGIAARYAIDHGPLPPTSRRIVKLLTPVMTEFTDDFETLAILAPALEKEGQNSLSRVCLDLIESSTGDLLVTRRIEAEVRLAGGENEQALDRCREILAEGSERNDLLKDILPVLIRLNATGEIIEVVRLLTESGKFDEDTANSLIDYLEIASATELEKDLAEMLLSEVDTPHRLVLTAVLARQFLRSKDYLRLVELGDHLLELSPGDVTNWADLHRALWAVGSALADLGEDEKAARLLEDQYFIRPDQAKPLRLLARLHMNRGRVLKATEYLELYQLIHPNESETAAILARNWFFHLGEFEKALKMVTDNRSFFQADPSMAMQIILGHALLRGSLKKSIKDIERYRFRKGVKTPEVLFLTGTIYYLLEKNDAALRIFRLLNEEFEDNRFAALVEHLIERISNMPKE
jgi:tetratricopeptide (TPR) repeat protein